MLKKTLSLLCLVLLVNLSKAQLKLTDKISFDPSITKGTLPNGLTYYIKKNTKPEKKVELRLVVNAGSILEDDDQQGLAHFTEHMAFNGTKNFKKNQLVDFLQTIGVEFGADLNAYTGFDETVYILPIPLTDTANYRKGMLILQDWAGGLLFENAEIDAERKVILEESRTGKGAEDRMFRKIYPVQYAGSKYAKRLPIGDETILKTFKYDAIKRFYRDWYRPNLMSVMVVGDIDIAKTEAMIKAMFSGLKNPAKPRPRIAASLAARTKNTAVVATDKEATNYQVELSYATLNTKEEVTVADFRESSMVKQLYSAILNQRMQELAQGANPPYLFAYNYISSYARGYETYNVAAVAGKDGPNAAIASAIKEVERARKFGFTQAELDRAKKQMMARMDKALANKDKTESANLIEEMIRNFLEKEPMPGIEREVEYFKTYLDGVTLKEVNDFDNFLDKNNKLFASFQGPDADKKSVPSETELLANITTAMAAPVANYEEKAIASTLIESLPTAGKITNTSTNEKLGTTTFTLSNGATVTFKPTEFKQDEIVMRSYRLNGIAKYNEADLLSAQFASQLVGAMGVGAFNPVDLKKFLAGKNVNAGTLLTSQFSGFRGNSTKADFETLLQLVHLYATKPREDKGLFDAWAGKQKSQSQFMWADPTIYFIDSLIKVMNDNNPLATKQFLKDADIDKISLEKVMRIYKENFGNANNHNFYFVGNVDIEKAKPLIEKYIGSLPSSTSTNAFYDNGLRNKKGNLTVDVKKGEEQKAMILNVYSGDVAYSEALGLKGDMLAEILNIKITEELREKIGGIYGGAISCNVTKEPYNNYSMMLQLPCGPESVQKLQDAMAAEIDKIKANGPEQKDIDKVKKTFLEKHKISVQENQYWVSSLQNIDMYKKSIDDFKNYEAIVNALTIKEIQEVANLLFDGKNVIKAELFPAAKK